MDHEEMTEADSGGAEVVETCGFCGVATTFLEFYQATGEKMTWSVIVHVRT